MNPSYRKQVTFTNLTNASDEHMIEFVANNVDRHSVSFHSLFYQLSLLRRTSEISSSSAANMAEGGAALSEQPTAWGEVSVPLPDQCFINFEDTVVRCAQVSAFCVRNISTRPLQLRVVSTVAGAEARVYKQARKGASQPPSAQALASYGLKADDQGGYIREWLLERLEERMERGTRNQRDPINVMDGMMQVGLTIDCRATRSPHFRDACFF